MTHAPDAPWLRAKDRDLSALAPWKQREAAERKLQAWFRRRIDVKKRLAVAERKLQASDEPWRAWVDADGTP